MIDWTITYTIQGDNSGDKFHKEFTGDINDLVRFTARMVKLGADNIDARPTPPPPPTVSPYDVLGAMEMERKIAKTRAKCAKRAKS